MASGSGLVMSKKQKLAPIQVYVRIRPSNNVDVPLAITDCTPKEIHVKGHKKGYTFDQIFDDKTSQIKIYKTVVSKMIGDVMKGYNCTVFAYGQTGTGKTFTILGGDTVSPIEDSFHWQQDTNAGIVLRAAVHLYEELNKMDPNIQRTVTVSFMEIYNEEIRDLLCDKELMPLRIYEDKSKCVHVKNLKEVTVLNPDEILTLLKKGCERRQVAATLMNNRSSRSHIVFTINVSTIQTISVAENLSNITCGKLNLIDLAGSENIAKSGSKEQRAREATNINQSLLTLGRVIKALVENSSHIPYRESKLTRILQDSLGGKTKTTIIATISPCVTSLEETVNTLDYAHNARSVTNCPMINLRTSATAAAVNEELLRLKRDLFATANEQGVYMDKENYEEMTHNLTQFRQDILSKHELIRTLKEQVEDLSTQRQEWENLRQSFDITRKAYQDCQSVIETNKGKMHTDRLLLEYYESETAKFKEFANMMTQRESHLHQKVSSLFSTSLKNQNVVETIINHIEDVMDKLVSNENNNSEELKGYISQLMNFNDNLVHMFNNVKNQLAKNAIKFDVNEIENPSSDNPFATEIQKMNESSKQAEDKVKFFIESCNNKVKELDERTEAAVMQLREFEKLLTGLKNMTLSKIADKELEMENDWGEDEEHFKELISEVIEQKRIFSISLQEISDLTKKHEMILERKIKKYEERRLKTKAKTCDFALFKEDITSLTQKAFQQITKINDKLSQHQTTSVQHSEEIITHFQDVQKEMWRVIKQLLQGFATENSDMARILDQISGILNVQGNIQLEQLNEMISAQRNSVTTIAESTKQEINTIISTSLVPVIHQGDTPQRLELPIATHRSRDSIVRRLAMTREEDESPTSSPDEGDASPP